jgi:predicted Zn-dependent protease
MNQQKRLVNIATWSSVGLLGAYFLVGCGGGSGGGGNNNPTPTPSSTPTPNPAGRLEIQGPAGVPCGFVVDNTGTGDGHCTQQTTYTVKAFDGNNQETAVNQNNVIWDRVAGTSLNPTTGGKVLSLNVGLTTLRARVNGLSGQKVVRVGFPLQVNVTTEGITADTGFRVQTKTFNPQYQVVDNTIDDYDFGGGFAPASFKWLLDRGVRPTSYDGYPVTIKANATQGSFAFQGWKVNGQVVWSAPTFTIDPKNPPAGAPSLDTDPYPALNIVAAYGPRTVTGGDYTPNYLNGSEVNHIVQWNLSQIRVTFSTAGQFTEDKKNQAIAGLNLWKRTIGNNNLFTVVANNDIANSDVIIAFPTDPNATDTHPGQPGWVAGYNIGDNIAKKTESLGGLTMWGINSSNADIGISHRLIHVYNSASDSIGPVSAHEFGHALGLDGHSNQGGDIMATSVNSNSFPVERDVNTALTLLNRSVSN